MFWQQCCCSCFYQPWQLCSVDVWQSVPCMLLFMPSLQVASTTATLSCVGHWRCCLAITGSTSHSSATNHWHLMEQPHHTNIEGHITLAASVSTHKFLKLRWWHMTICGRSPAYFWDVRVHVFSIAFSAGLFCWPWRHNLPCTRTVLST